MKSRNEKARKAAIHDRCSSERRSPVERRRKANTSRRNENESVGLEKERGINYASERVELD